MAWTGRRKRRRSFPARSTIDRRAGGVIIAHGSYGKLSSLSVCLPKFMMVTACLMTCFKGYYIIWPSRLHDIISIFFTHEVYH